MKRKLGKEVSDVVNHVPADGRYPMKVLNANAVDTSKDPGSLRESLTEKGSPSEKGAKCILGEKKTWADALSCTSVPNANSSSAFSSMRTRNSGQNVSSEMNALPGDRSVSSLSDSSKLSWKTVVCNLPSSSLIASACSETPVSSTTDDKRTSSKEKTKVEESKEVMRALPSADSLQLVEDLKKEEGSLESEEKGNRTSDEPDEKEREGESVLLCNPDAGTAKARPASTKVVKLPKDPSQKGGSHVTTISSETSIETLRALRQFGAGFFLSSNASAPHKVLERSASHEPLKKPICCYSTTSVSSTPRLTVDVTRLQEGMECTRKKVEKFSDSCRANTSTLLNENVNTDERWMEIAERKMADRALSPVVVRNSSNDKASDTASHATFTDNMGGTGLLATDKAGPKDEEETADLLTAMLLRYCRTSETFTAASAKRLNLNPQGYPNETAGSTSNESRVETGQKDVDCSTPCNTTGFPPPVGENGTEDNKVPPTWSVKQEIGSTDETESETTHTSRSGRSDMTSRTEEATSLDSHEKQSEDEKNEEEIKLPPSPAPPTPELVLFGELKDLFMTRDVTAHLLEVMRELLSHTKVIPHYHFCSNGNLQQQNSSKGGGSITGNPKGSNCTEGRNSNGSAESSTEADGCHTTVLQEQQQQALVEEARRRENAHQVILILLKQMEEKKMQESKGIETVPTETLLKRVEDALEAITFSHSPPFETTTTSNLSTSNSSIPVFSTGVPFSAAPVPNMLKEFNYNLFSTTVQTNYSMDHPFSAASGDPSSWPISAVNSTTDWTHLSPMSTSSPTSLAFLPLLPKLSFRSSSEHAPGEFSSATPDVRFASPSVAAHKTIEECCYENNDYSPYACSTLPGHPVSVPVSVQSMAECTRLTRFGVQQFSYSSNSPGEVPHHLVSSRNDPIHSSPYASFVPSASPLPSGPVPKRMKKGRERKKASKCGELPSVQNAGTDLHGNNSVGLGMACAPSKSASFAQPYSPFQRLLPFTCASPSLYSTPKPVSQSSAFPLPFSGHSAAFNSTTAVTGVAVKVHNPFVSQVLEETRTHSSVSSVSSTSSSPDTFQWRLNINEEEWFSGQDETQRSLQVQLERGKSNESSPTLSYPPPSEPTNPSECVSSPCHLENLQECLCSGPTDIAAVRTTQHRCTLPSFDSKPTSQKNSLCCLIKEEEGVSKHLPLSSDDLSSPPERKTPDHEMALRNQNMRAATFHSSQTTFVEGQTKTLPSIPIEESEEGRKIRMEASVDCLGVDGSLQTAIKQPEDKDLGHLPEFFSEAIPSFTAVRAAGGSVTSIEHTTFLASSTPSAIPDREIHEILSAPMEEISILPIEPFSSSASPTLKQIERTVTHPFDDQHFTEAVPRVASPLLVNSSASMHGTPLTSPSFAQWSTESLQTCTLPPTPQTYQMDFNSPVGRQGDEATEVDKGPSTPASRLNYSTLLETSPVPRPCISSAVSALHPLRLECESRERVQLSYDCGEPHDRIFGGVPFLFNFDVENDHDQHAVKKKGDTGFTAKNQPLTSEQSHGKSENMMMKPEEEERVHTCPGEHSKTPLDEMVNLTALPLVGSNPWESPPSWSCSETFLNVNAQDFVPSSLSFTIPTDPETIFQSTETHTVPHTGTNSLTFDVPSPLWFSSNPSRIGSNTLPLPSQHSSSTPELFASRNANCWPSVGGKSKKERFIDSAVMQINALASCMDPTSVSHGPSQRRKVPNGEAVLIHRVEKPLTRGNGISH